MEPKIYQSSGRVQVSETSPFPKGHLSLGKDHPTHSPSGMTKSPLIPGWITAVLEIGCTPHADLLLEALHQATLGVGERHCLDDILPGLMSSLGSLSVCFPLLPYSFCLFSLTK